jgi:hypothetical protein
VLQGTSNSLVAVEKQLKDFIVSSSLKDDMQKFNKAHAQIQNPSMNLEELTRLTIHISEQIQVAKMVTQH